MVFLSINCASLRPDKFDISRPSGPGLPLKLIIDRDSFERNKAGAQSDREKFLAENKELIESWKKMNPGKEPDTSAILGSAPELIQHTLNEAETSEMIWYVKEQLNRNLLDPKNENKGFAECRLVYRKTKRGFKMFLYFIPSVSTVFLINFLGFPVGCLSTELQLELSIQDRNGKEIAKYSSTGKGSGYAAMYWGYNMTRGGVPYSYSDTSRASYLNALRQSVGSLLEKVNKDAPSLMNKLGGY
jgi:hypothetical protein